MVMVGVKEPAIIGPGEQAQCVVPGVAGGGGKSLGDKLRQTNGGQAVFGPNMTILPPTHVPILYMGTVNPRAGGLLGHTEI